MKKIIIPILVVLVLLIVPTIPGQRLEAPTTSGSGECIRLMIGNNDDGLEIEDIAVDGAVAEQFLTSITDFQNWIENARPFQDRQITPEELVDIKANINGLLAALNTILEENEHDPIDESWLYQEMFETEIGRSTICSVGIGYAFIPFYDYETFLGVMLRPIWLWYPSAFFGGGGYTGNLNLNVIPPRIEYGDRLGSHIVRTTYFSGLYINVGELGFDGKLIGGPMILLGQARVVM